MLNRLAIGITALAGALVFSVAAAAVLAPYADGPLFIFPGGPPKTGPLVPYDGVDWDALADVAEVEFQLEVPPRTRTTYLLVLENTPYIPCAFCTNARIKRWPRQLLGDDRVVLRVNGQRIEGRAVRVFDTRELEALFELRAKKYASVNSIDRLGAALDSGDRPSEDWMYRIEQR